MYFRGKLPGLKYAKGVSKWPVFFQDEFYSTYDAAKQASGSEFFQKIRNFMKFHFWLWKMILNSKTQQKTECQVYRLLTLLLT